MRYVDGEIRLRAVTPVPATGLEEVGRQTPTLPREGAVGQSAIVYGTGNSISRTGMGAGSQWLHTC